MVRVWDRVRSPAFMSWENLPEFRGKKLEVDGKKTRCWCWWDFGCAAVPPNPPKGVGCQGPGSARLLVLGTAPGWAWGQNVGVSHTAPAGKAPADPGQGRGLGNSSGGFALLGSLLPGGLGTMAGFGYPSHKPHAEPKHHSVSPNQIIRDYLVHIK